MLAARCCHFTWTMVYSFSALTLLVEWQAGLLACRDLAHSNPQSSSGGGVLNPTWYNLWEMGWLNGN